MAAKYEGKWLIMWRNVAAIMKRRRPIFLFMKKMTSREKWRNERSNGWNSIKLWKWLLSMKAADLISKWKKWRRNGWIMSICGIWYSMKKKRNIQRKILSKVNINLMILMICEKTINNVYYSMNNDTEEINNIIRNIQ